MYRLLDKIIEKGLTGELTKKDYYKLKEIYNDIKDPVTRNNVEKMLDNIYHTELLHHFSDDNCAYITKNAYLLPLVLANYNNNVKITSTDHFLLSCPFHIDTHSSFEVIDSKNIGYCFGCGINVNSISYLMYKENIDFNKSVELLAKIYLFDIKQNNYNLDNLVLKYKKAILSEKYENLLEKANELRDKKNINSSKYIEDFDDRMNTILRISNNEYDTHFKYKKPKTKIKIDLTKYN